MFMNKTLCIRMREFEYNRLVNLVNKKSDKYQNISHFCRCAIIKQINKTR